MNTNDLESLSSITTTIHQPQPVALIKNTNQDNTPTTSTTTIGASNTTSTTYVVSPINCQSSTISKSFTENSTTSNHEYNHLLDRESSCLLNKTTATTTTTTTITDNNCQNNIMKVLAPIMTHDVTLPNTNKKVPMVMVPVPDSMTLMAIPISTLNHLKETQLQGSMKDEQQARDLLIWENGIGTLDGCDLRFRTNQLGCLELLDSDDEEINSSENRNTATTTTPTTNTTTTTTNKQKIKFNATIQQQAQQQQIAISANNLNKNNNNNNIVNNSNKSNHGALSNAIISSSKDEKLPKKVKLDSEIASIRQISPGSSLLRDGPTNNARRPKQTTSTGTSQLSTINNNRANISNNNSFDKLTQAETLRKLFLIDELIRQGKLNELKSSGRKSPINNRSVDEWTVEDVKNFINNIPGCSGCGDLLANQQICGKSLLYLDQKDLLDVINVKLGPAVKIYHAILRLK